jgi:hypothetical protein
MSMCLINQALLHEHVWRSGGTAPPFSILALGGGELYVPPALLLGKFLGGWVGAPQSVRMIWRRENMNSGRPSRSRSRYQLSYPNF